MLKNKEENKRNYKLENFLFIYNGKNKNERELNGIRLLVHQR